MVLTPIAKMELEQANELPETLRGEVDLAQQVNGQNLNKSQVARYSRQIILKNIGALGQKIIKSKVLIIGIGLGCSVAEFLTRAGVQSWDN